jgi:peptidyl-prolyl cis-trans isomerase D
LLAEKGSEAPKFEEQKASIEEQLKRAGAESQFVTQLEKLREESYNAENLAEVAQSLGLKVQNSGLFERNKGKDLMANAKVVAAAFSPEVLQDGNASDAIEIDASTVVVLKKTEHKPSQIKPIADVREQISNTLKDQKARTLLSEQAAKLIADLKSGAKFDELTKANSVELKQVKAATRSSADVDSDVLRYAFSMSKPKAGTASYGSVMTSAGDIAVVALEAVTPGNFEKVTPEQKTAIVAQLGTIYGRNDFASYQKFLKDAAEIE